MLGVGVGTSDGSGSGSGSSELFSMVSGVLREIHGPIYGARADGAP